LLEDKKDIVKGGRGQEVAEVCHEVFGKRIKKLNSLTVAAGGMNVCE
jgi:hypothetical protein